MELEGADLDLLHAAHGEVEEDRLLDPGVHDPARRPGRSGGDATRSSPLSSASIVREHGVLVRGVLEQRAVAKAASISERAWSVMGGVVAGTGPRSTPACSGPRCALGRDRFRPAAHAGKQRLERGSSSVSSPAARSRRFRARRGCARGSRAHAHTRLRRLLHGGVDLVRGDLAVASARPEHAGG